MSENSLPFAHRTEREPSFKALGGALKRESRRRLLEIQATEKQGLPTLVENYQKKSTIFLMIKITVKFSVKIKKKTKNRALIDPNLRGKIIKTKF